ncbi:MAG: hypothetical protein ACPG21_05090 [Crocinitomicaceae bacterium]
MKSNLTLLLFLLCCSNIIAHTQNAELKGIQNDIFLHPADGFTAYTLKK